MAVSMNSGFMRSDFMISDAALPMRMEELEQLEQAAKFSEILGGFGKTPANEAQTNVAPANEAADAPVAAISAINTEKGETEVTVVVSKEELKELAMAVVKGRIKLDELPEALVTDGLLMAIAMIMLGVPEDEIKALQEDVTFTVTEIEKEAMSQFVSLMVVPKLNSEAEQNANTAEAMPADLIEIPDELRAELEMIIDKLVGTEEAKTEVEADVKTDAASDTEKQIVSEGDKPTEETAVKTVSENMIPDAAEPVVTYKSVKDTEETTETAPVKKISTDADVEIQEQKNVFVEITSEATEELFTVSEQTIEGSKQPVEVSKQQITVSEQPFTISEELEQIRKIITEPSARKTEATQTVAATEAATVQAVTQTASTQQNNGADEQTQSFVKADVNPMQTTASDNADQLQAEFEQLRSIVSEIQVKHESPKPIVQQPMSRVPQEFRTDETVKNRMVVKSDELMMLKNASKPAVDNEAAATQAAMIPQGNTEQLPVVFTRADGTEFAVKPEEILKQVADNIIQHTETANAEGNTEYSVTLTPEDLGSITVRMTKTADGTFSVSITADNARTQRIIEESGLAIQNSLKQNGIELESWQTVNESEQQERAEDYNGSSKNPYYQEEQSENDEAEDTSFAEMISEM